MTDTTAEAAEIAPRIPTLRARIAALDVGESLGELKRLSLAEADAALMASQLEQMRNRIAPALARAKRDTGNDYSLENGSFFNRQRDLILVLAVTRTN